MKFKPVFLSELVSQFGGELACLAEHTVAVEKLTLIGFSTLAAATQSHLSFLSNPKYRKQVFSTQAAAVLISKKEWKSLEPELVQLKSSKPDLAPPASVFWIIDDPYLTYALVQQWWVSVSVPPTMPGIHPTAVIHDSAYIAPSASVGAHVTIGANTVVGVGANLLPGVVIGSDVTIGEGSVLYPNVSIYDHCIIGKRNIIHSGAVIGADGFGFAPHQNTWVKIPQVGRVITGEDVEIGANTTIDRGALDDTLIGIGVKLDNQIQIGHNVTVGEHTAIAGCTGVAGSTKIGARCAIGGACMIIGHLSIADGVHLSAGSAVISSIEKPGAYSGLFPLDTHKNWERTAAVLRNITDLRARIRSLEKS